MKPRALLINPWIYDFAAFDLWAKPLGLLYLSTLLKKTGFQVRLADCLDRLHPDSAAPPAKKRWAAGTGQWARAEVAKPLALADIPRQWSRYGWPEDLFVREVSAGPRPDVILVTSSMTYWYPGVHRAVSLAKEVWPEIPVWLGGTYATLCPEHARRYSGADRVFTGPGEAALLSAAAEMLGVEPLESLAGRVLALEEWPDLDICPRIDFAPLMTSRGCPYSCPYCASDQTFPGFIERTHDSILAEMEDRIGRLGLTDFTFFDDALLINWEKRLAPVLEEVVRRGLRLRFHAPNGMHVGLITRELAELMFRAGFQTLRLGLESLDAARQKELGGKVLPGQFETAVKNLQAAGFDRDRIGGYILYGLPGQPLEEVITTADAVRGLGVRPYLAEFSPLPGTPFWRDALEASTFDLAGEPLYHNNTFFPCRGEEFSWDNVWRIKRAALGG